MFLIEPQPTPYDLHFRVLGVSTRVHPMFWLFSLVLGWPNLPDGMKHYTVPFALIWVAAVFVSILLHELGHVFAGRLFGTHGYIILYSFGGLAVGSSAVARRWQRILVLFAGPLAQLVFLAGLALLYWFVVLRPDRDLNPLADRAFRVLLFINLFWPILNLLPIWPLDGGQISRELATKIAPDRGVRISLGLSMLTSALIMANALVLNQTGQPLIPVVGWFTGSSLFTMIFFGLLAVGSFQALQQAEQERRWRDDHWYRE